MCFDARSAELIDNNLGFEQVGKNSVECRTFLFIKIEGELIMNGAGLLMIGAVLLLFIYMLLAKRSRFLPFLPFGFLIVYFAIRAIFQFVGHLPIVSEYDKWIGVASSVILIMGRYPPDFCPAYRIATKILERD